MKHIFIFAVGIVLGIGIFALYEASTVPVVTGSAQGCIHDGYIVHADGTKTVNWVCYDPNELI